MPRLLLRVIFCFALSLILLGGATDSHAKRIGAPTLQTTTSGAGYRFDKGGWKYVHLEGSPAEIGYQHGQLLAAEIADLLNVLKVETLHDSKRDWNFYREASRKMLWSHIDEEYQQEMEGIAKGAQSKGVKVDVWDIVAINGAIELPSYYVPWLNKREHAMNAPHILPDGHCSAFIATGSYTKDGKIVIAHNNWSSYADGERWTVMFDIQPEHGHRMVMDGEPGVITSQDDFGVTDAGRPRSFSQSRRFSYIWRRYSIACVFSGEMACTASYAFTASTWFANFET